MNYQQAYNILDEANEELLRQIQNAQYDLSEDKVDHILRRAAPVGLKGFPGYAQDFSRAYWLEMLKDLMNKNVKLVERLRFYESRKEQGKVELRLMMDFDLSVDGIYEPA